MRSSASSIRCLRVAPFDPVQAAEEIEILPGRQVGIDGQILRDRLPVLLRNSRLFGRQLAPVKPDRPESGARRPTTMFIVVDLPAPLGPKRPKTSPAATEKLTSSTATRLPKVFRRLQTSRRFIECQAFSRQQSPNGARDRGTAMVCDRHFERSEFTRTDAPAA